ncbi:pyrimidine dimer DNA glycosylase/endonuclease V [Bacteroidota bacterium]
MRIWSLHPKYLDTKGLIALWRETLLAKKVLEGKTVGYRNHPQLFRFKQVHEPLNSIHQYLFYVYQEATTRGYNFNKNKFEGEFNPTTMTVTKGQLNYEIIHLLNKLKIRDTLKHTELINTTRIEPHPLFKLVEGDVEEWEKQGSSVP